MFTGIIEEVGSVVNLQRVGGGVRLDINAPKSNNELEINDSVAINGVCQTVISKTLTSFKVEAVEETLKKTTLGSLIIGQMVNIELPLKFSERLGGHLLLGHVDTVGHIIKIENRETSWIFTMKIPRQFSKYVVSEGSLAVDGVSLTVAEIENASVKVSIIPHTMRNTIFKTYRLNTAINLEFDIIGKYIEHMMTTHGTSIKNSNSITEADLKRMGF